MSDIDVLEVAPRPESGKLRNRRLRACGQLPAVLYGHGEDPVSLAIPTEKLEASLRHGAHVVELQGAAKGQALLHDIQWDTFQQHILHVDLLRVDDSDRVTVAIPLELRGIAPGESEGGLVEVMHREIEIETSPTEIPDHVEVNVNDLHLGGELKVSDLEGLPEGAKLTLELSVTVVHCIDRPVVEEEEEAEAIAAEPEVIGEKKDEDTEGGD